MAATLKGAAVVWGTNGITATGVVIDATKGSITNAGLNWDCERQDIENSVGETVGTILYNFKQTYSLSIVPLDASTSPSISNAKQNLDNIFIQPGTVITITDADTSKEINNGKFLVLSSRLNRTNKGMATIEVECVAYAHCDITKEVS